MKSLIVVFIVSLIITYTIQFSCAKTYAPEQDFSYDLTPTILTNGRSLYNSICARCHGLDGRREYHPKQGPTVGRTPRGAYKNSILYDYIIKPIAQLSPQKVYNALLRYKSMRIKNSNNKSVQIMIDIASTLSEPEIRTIAGYTQMFPKS